MKQFGQPKYFSQLEIWEQSGFRCEGKLSKNHNATVAVMNITGYSQLQGSKFRTKIEAIQKMYTSGCYVGLHV